MGIAEQKFNEQSMVVHVRYNSWSGTFLRRPLQNSNVKWPNPALSGEHKPRGYFIKFVFQIYFCAPDLVF